MRDIIFSVFDKKKGPIILYSSIESEEIAKKVAVRSFIAIGAMEEDQDLNGRHAVVPIHNLDKIGYYYMFRINEGSNKLIDHSSPWAILGFLEDSSRKISFYRSIPLLEKMILPVVDLIQKGFMYEGVEIEINPNLKKKIKELCIIDVNEIVDSSPEIIVPSQKSLEMPIEDFKTGDLNFLFNYFPQDLDKVVYSLMLEEAILVIGDINEIVQKVVASIELLVPHRILSKRMIQSYIDPKGEDFLISLSHIDLIKKYKNVTALNVITRKITSKIKGVPSIAELINTLKYESKAKQKISIQEFVDKLLVKTADLMALCEKEQISREEIQELRKDLKGDELNIIISLVHRYAPHFENKLFYFARSMI